MTTDHALVPAPADDVVEGTATELPKLWEKQPWESDTQYHHFYEYYLKQELRPRQLHEAYRRFRAAKGQTGGSIRNAPGNWRRWAKALDNYEKPIPGAYTWEQRALAYDQYLRGLEFMAEQDLLAQRRREIREMEFDAGKKLMARAHRMQAAVLFEKHEEKTVVSPDGKTIYQSITYKPAEWGERDIANALKIASELMRHSVDMPANKPSTDWRSELAQIAPNVDPDEFIDAFADFLARFAARGT